MTEIFNFYTVAIIAWTGASMLGIRFAIATNRPRLVDSLRKASVFVLVVAFVSLHAIMAYVYLPQIFNGAQ